MSMTPTGSKTDFSNDYTVFREKYQIYGQRVANYACGYHFMKAVLSEVVILPMVLQSRNIQKSRDIPKRESAISSSDEVVKRRGCQVRSLSRDDRGGFRRRGRRFRPAVGREVVRRIAFWLPIAIVRLMMGRR